MTWKKLAVVGTVSIIAVVLVAVSFLLIERETTVNPVGNIVGQVANEHGNPIPGLRIDILNGTAPFPEISPVTDAEGEYKFQDLPPGTFELAVNDDHGNLLKTLTVTVKANETMSANFVVPGFTSLEGEVIRVLWKKTGGLLGLKEELNIEPNGPTTYSSNLSGDLELVFPEFELDSLLSLLEKADFFSLNRSYSAISSATDYYSYSLTVETTRDAKIVEWVDEGASEKPLPIGLLDIQFFLQDTIQRIQENEGESENAIDRAIRISTDFILQAPTFRYDGISNTLNVTYAKALESLPIQYVITVSFDSSHSGYGDRTEQELPEVITPHTAVVILVNDKVVSAILDNQWDELRQETIVLEVQQGVISGKVDIGPLCPVEPCPDPQPEIYSSREIILQPEIGNSIHIRLSSDGSFQAVVDTGTYTINLTDCTFLGCTIKLPMTITVEADTVIWVDIIIDTGIR